MTGFGEAGLVPRMDRVMELAEAKKRLLDGLHPERLDADDGFVVLDGETIEKPYGWIFFYQSKKYLETGELKGGYLAFLRRTGVGRPGH